MYSFESHQIKTNYLNMTLKFYIYKYAQAGGGETAKQVIKFRLTLSLSTSIWQTQYK